MEINQDGSLKIPQRENGQLTNEEIVWLYLSLKGAYISRQEEFKKKIKQAKALEAMLITMSEDDDQKETAEKIREKISEMTREAEEKGFPEDKYMVGVFTSLKEKFFMIKESDEELVNDIAKECFNDESKVMQKILNETEDQA
jgi:hypothetical protein